jgi:succinyl-diaminopimelate desuccinylase
MKTSRTLALTEELIALDLGHAGRQGLPAAAWPSCWRRSAFVCETIESNGVTNLWARKGTESPVFVFAGHTDVVPTGPSSSGPRSPSCRPSATASCMAAARPT